MCTFWYATIQYRKGERRWIFFMYMFFKTNTAWKVSKCGVFSGPYIPLFTPYLSVFSQNAGIYGPEKTPYLDTFHAVQLYLNIATICCVPRTSGNWPLRPLTNFRELQQIFYEILILRRSYSTWVWIEGAKFSLKLYKILNLGTLSLKTSAAESDERFSNWRKFWLTKSFF